MAHHTAALKRHCAEEGIMNAQLLFGVAIAGLLMAAPAAGSPDQKCCDQPSKPCCAATMACCTHDHEPPLEPVVSQTIAARPEVERVIVRFENPVWVGDRVLMGKYIIEHDNNRMARGWPCTYVYAYDDPRLPVVAFRCTHLKRPASERGSVTLVSTGGPGNPRRWTEFQFKGEVGAHGVPRGR
jgi:hypothetical protein